MERYWKGSDMRLNIHITDNKGEEIPLSSILSMTIHLFTIGCEYVEYNYPQSILEDEKGLYIPINENALAYLPDGFLRWEAHFKVKDGDWEDGKDIVKGCRTDIFVKTPRDYVAKPNVQEKEITITENGEYEVLPDAGYEGMSSMTVNVNLDINPYYKEGFMRFLKKEASGKFTLPIEAMDTPYCLYKQTGITEVVVPEGATAIPNNFFQGCTSLAKITYPDSVISFGDNIYGNIDYERIMSFPLPHYLQSAGTGNVYYKEGEIFNVPKYINTFQKYNSNAIDSYNGGVAKKLIFKGNFYQFYFMSFNAEEVDFRYNVQVPTFDYASIYTGMTKVIVPESLYDSWITTSPWSDYAAITESVPDTDYFIHYQTKSGNDIPRNIGVMDNRYAVISSSDKKIHLRGTPWHLEGIVNSPDVTYVDFAAANLEVPSFSYLFSQAESLTGYTLPLNKPISCHGMFYNCRQLTTVLPMDTSCVTDMASMFGYCFLLTSLPEMNTSNVTDMTYMFEECQSLTTVPPMDTSRVSDMRGMFKTCYSLTDLGGLIGLKVNLDLSSCPKLTHESLLNVINKAADVTKAPATLTLGATNIAKLADAEKAIATSKGWTLA